MSAGGSRHMRDYMAGRIDSAEYMRRTKADVDELRRRIRENERRQRVLLGLIRRRFDCLRRYLRAGL